MDRHSVTPAGTGLAAAAAGALVGAWLGFSVTDAGFGFVAPFVAIVGATAGANLALLLLDIAWDHQARVSSEAGDATDASPTVVSA
jgi:hypothetical protein